MPGRRSTGPPVSTPVKTKRRKSKRALDALAIAEQENPRKNKTRQSRLGEVEDQGPKRRREENDNEDDGEEEDGATASKRPRRGDKDRFGIEIEVGSDSSGNEWAIGQVGEDDDSELDSDEAFGESDEEKFEGFKFGRNGDARRTREMRHGAIGGGEGGGKYARFDLDEGDVYGAKEHGASEDEESDGFAEDAVDLAGVLDDGGSDMDDSDGSEDESGPTEDESDLSISEDENTTGEKEKLASLQALVSTMNKQDASAPRSRAVVDAQESATPSEFGVNPKRKLTVADLVPSVTDPKLRQSLKLLADSSTKSSSKRGISKKLDVPLPKRQQDRLDRAAAGEKSKETLNRWIDTVKHNRRAEHLFFPLQNPNAVVPPGSKRLLNSDQTKPVTDLEKTIQSILQEQGLGPGKSEEDQIQEIEELEANKLPLAEVQARRAELRRARELLFREEIRAKRIKKIKSKSFRKVHRKERERNAQHEKSILAEAGVIDSESEKERNDRRRAEERMGARHRESKWAKSVKDSGKARWDEDARNGVTEMARREEELKKRIEGREINGSDDSSIDDDDEEIEDDESQLKKLSGRLQVLEADEDPNAGPEGLAGMPFMKKAEAARKARNDDDTERLRRDLAGEETPTEEEADQGAGRRSYGPVKRLKDGRPANPFSTVEKSELEEKPDSGGDEVTSGFQGFEDDTEIITDAPQMPHSNSSNGKQSISNSKFREQQPRAAPSNDLASNPWLSASKTPSDRSKKRREDSDAGAIISNTLPPPPSEPPSSTPSQPKPRALKGSRQAEKSQSSALEIDDTPPTTHHVSKSDTPSPANSDDETTNDLPLLPSNASLIHRAFAGDSVLASFTAEKAAATASAAPQETSTALPGWGSWTGPGISRKDRKREVSRARASITSTPGIDPSKRKDAKLDKVIIHQGKVKKNGKYLAREVPFPYETARQYERSLRVPVGGEWVTKETLQDGTRPRVLRRQGVVGAIEMPVV